MSRLHGLKVEQTSEESPYLVDCGGEILILNRLLHALSNIDEGQSIAQ